MENSNTTKEKGPVVRNLIVGDIIIKDFTVAELVNKMKSGEITMPKCQRSDKRWPRKKKGDWLYSLVVRDAKNNEILEAYQDEETGKLFMIDGQQRLTALVDIIKEGIQILVESYNMGLVKIPLFEDPVDLFELMHRRLFTELHPDIQKEIWGKVFKVKVRVNCPPELTKFEFRGINSGVALTSSEKRASRMSDDVLNTITEFIDKYKFFKSINVSNTSIDTQGLVDISTIIVKIVLIGEPFDVSTQTLNSFLDNLSNGKSSIGGNEIIKIVSIFDYMEKVVKQLVDSGGGFVKVIGNRKVYTNFSKYSFLSIVLLSLTAFEKNVSPKSFAEFIDWFFLRQINDEYRTSMAHMGGTKQSFTIRNKILMEKFDKFFSTGKPGKHSKK